MDYPTLQQVEAADAEQLARWWRFLPSPGMNANCSGASAGEIEAAIERERPIWNTIKERFEAAGGMTPELSKRIGWGDLTGVVKEK